MTTEKTLAAILTLLAAERAGAHPPTETLLARAGLTEDEIASVVDRAAHPAVLPAWTGSVIDRAREHATAGRR